MAKTKQKSKRKLHLVQHRRPPMTDIFLRALAAMYPTDRLTAGIVLAYLPRDKKFYGSVCRYTPTKEIVVSVKDDSVLEVLQSLANGWYEKTQPLLDFNLRMQQKMRRVK